MKTVVVTGFGAFPGARSNPTLALMRRLQRHAGRFARLGWRLETRFLPVVYAAIGPALATIERECAPDALLHFGLAARRRAISVETRAQNRLLPLKVDAARRLPPRGLAPGGAEFLPVRLSAARLRAAIAASGARCGLSRDAGGYVCNQTLYLSLAHSRATQVGFVHTPKLSHLPGRLDGLERAALAALFVLLRGVSHMDSR